MIRPPPRATRTDTLCPDTTLFRSTRTARVDIGYGPRDRTRNARNNVPMKGWKVAGVKSRLEVSAVTAAVGEQQTNLKEFVDLAGGTVGDYGYTRINEHRPLVLHATHDKRSEEHTSELQSLMRISYAVFCLKKKKKTH